MVHEMVLRSVYLRPSEDSQLRQLAHKLNVTKSDLIRSAINVKLRDWLAPGDQTVLLEDLEHGKRSESAVRSGRVKANATKAEEPSRSAKSTPVAKALDKEKDHAEGMVAAA